MTLHQLSNRNEKFQQSATEIAELVPGGNLLGFSTTLIRGAQKLDRNLTRIIEVKTEARFFQSIEAMEDEMDEMVYLLDKLESINRKDQLVAINDFLKIGYELLSLYSLCCDQVIERRAKIGKKIK